jgi:RecA-family ATPase
MTNNVHQLHPDGSTPLKFLDIRNWDHQPVPERQWTIRDRSLRGQITLFTGEGGTGKSLVELAKNVAHVCGKEWLGALPEVGPTIYLGAEDDEDEIHIRLASIARHYEASFAELAGAGLHILPLLGEDAVLVAANTRSGRVETTQLYRRLYQAAGDIKPVNLSIDTLSRAFVGNEIDRTQVYGFAQHMQALAKVANGSVTVLSHPSLSGIASGSGISGSTAWHGAFRFRHYLKSAKSDEADKAPDHDLRELEFKKNQYGPRTDSIVLRYTAGLFLPVPGQTSFDRLVRDAKAEDVFLTLLRRYIDQGRPVCSKPRANNYAPVIFARDAEATKSGLRKTDFDAAMQRLFDQNKVGLASYGFPSRGLEQLVVR